MILLDSHAFIWLAEGHPRLGNAAKRSIDQAFQTDSLYLSPISLWEISLKASRGKLLFDRPLRAWMQNALHLTRAQLAPITPDVAIECAELPAEFHGDPADRIIAATARVNALVLLTEDRKLLALARKGYFQAQEV